MVPDSIRRQRLVVLAALGLALVTVPVLLAVLLIAG